MRIVSRASAMAYVIQRRTARTVRIVPQATVVVTACVRVKKIVPIAKLTVVSLHPVAMDPAIKVRIGADALKTVAITHRPRLAPAQTALIMIAISL